MARHGGLPVVTTAQDSESDQRETPLPFLPIVVIPAYQEAASIASIVAGCLAWDLAVVVVDDGSTDETSAEAARAGAAVFRLAKNKGKGAALRKGIAAALVAGATHIVTVDGDGQHRPEDLPHLLALARDKPCALIVGSRRSDRPAAPRGRRLANAIADFWVGWAAGLRIEDSQSGFRIYPSALLPALVTLKPSRFAWEAAALIEAGARGLDIAAVAIPSLYDRSRRPSHFRPVADIVRITIAVGAVLLRRKLYLRGLWRSLNR